MCSLLYYYFKEYKLYFHRTIVFYVLKISYVDKR